MLSFSLFLPKNHQRFCIAAQACNETDESSCFFPFSFVLSLIDTYLEPASFHTTALVVTNLKSDLLSATRIWYPDSSPPMAYRQVTPPANFDYEDFTHTLQCPGGSASTNASYYGQDWSPESIMTNGTAITTPPRSPAIAKVREIGPTLLPRVRTQDQAMDTAPAQTFVGHHRTASLPVNALPQFGNYLSAGQATYRRSTSPLGIADLPTPGSAPLAYDHMMMDAASRRPSLGARSHSTANIRTHSRNSSSTSIDASVLGRYGFPTYRQSPTPQPGLISGAPMSRTPSAMSHLAPIPMPNGQIQSYPSRRRTASPPAMPSRLSTEIDFDPQLDLTKSTMLEYLTAPNPTPSLTQRTIEPTRGQQSYLWFDIRNVSAWSDFNVATMSAMPDLLNLMQFEVTLRDLPTPGKVNIIPETPGQLAELCANFHAVKVNAALKLAQGDKHMAMRTLRTVPGCREQPEFVSNYQSDVEKTIYGDGRGRVVGIVKCYDQWNSGMRNGTPGNRVDYLKGLAYLHHFMREHGCRYGFIMTEIELVCVRAGGAPSADTTIPLFGCLEVAHPVQIATCGKGENGSLQMTAGLALWYLHMLAKEVPLPGQFHWKLDVGGPAALTRQRHLERDPWMPKPNLSEKRAAKRVRGWVWPDEPLSKREVGRGRRNRS